MQTKTALLIMAAGLGSRYGGDKQVDGIGPHGEALMQYSIYDAVQAGFSKIVFVIKPQHREIINRFCQTLTGVEIACVYQDFSSLPASYSLPPERVKPFGTVHAVLCGKEAICEPFAVINADDYYGKDAFVTMHRALVSLQEGEAAMVGYRLKNTVSRNGAVTRGICMVKNGRLAHVKETYRIGVGADGVIFDETDGILDPDVLVSMNMWGFRPEIFHEMGDSFASFLTKEAGDNLKAEYALPTFVDRQLRENGLSVRVLSTEAQWFGVTYREDRPTVVECLQQMHERGDYPNLTCE
ncbi:MAG: NTP transferase domain-containing protein [Clostridia bacterium]|nr:NTP transferase domain-containing protein [Clostridia bacterium]